MLRFFERLVDPYPDAPPPTPPARLLPFVWAGTHGLRRYILAMTLLTAAIGAFEALLFSMLGGIVDWLSEVPRQALWQQAGPQLLGLGAILLLGASLAACGSFDGASARIASVVTPYKVDVVQGNFISREQVEALQAGMGRQQVRDILGTPLVTSLQSEAELVSSSGGDTLMQGTQVKANGGYAINAGVGDKARADARIILEGVKTTVQESKTAKSDYVVWQSMSGSGSTSAGRIWLSSSSLSSTSSSAASSTRQSAKRSSGFFASMRASTPRKAPRLSGSGGSICTWLTTVWV